MSRWPDQPWWGPAVWLTGLALLIASIAVSITVGASNISTAGVFQIAWAKLTGGPSGMPLVREAIVWDGRMPRALLAALCGAGLAVCGAVLQSLLRNPLADPYMLGISSGAGLGAVTMIVFGAGAASIGLAGGAFIGGAAAFVLVLLIARIAGQSVAVLILTGVAVTQFGSAATSFVIFAFADVHQTRGAMFWLLGSLASSSWNDVALSAVVVALALAVCFALSAQLDAFSFGEDAASSLGVDVPRMRFLLLGVTALVTAVLVSSSGAIGFVGLTLPHAARAVVGVKHRLLVPVSALFGAIFLVWADTAARTLFAPEELPVGVMTALIGVPVFVAILVGKQRRQTLATAGAGR
ncbi:MAG: iron chelate uptake ABC transporter family permease subunit [Gordonia sp. (in: high G+C Gram-positive bacteria)]